MSVFSCVDWWLRPVVKSAVPSVDLIASDGSCGETNAGDFNIDLRRDFVISSKSMPPALTEWLRDTIPTHPLIAQTAEWSVGALTASYNGRPEVIAVAVRHENGEPVQAIGFVAANTLSLAANTAPDRVRLPAEMEASGKLTDYFGVHVMANGSALRTQMSRLEFMQAGKVAAAHGGMIILVGLREAGLRELAPGGLPRNRGLEFIGLFSLAAGLVLSSLLLLQRKAELARTRANFVSGISHELRTPLAQIRMFAEMLVLGRVRNDTDRRRSLEIIDTEARRLSHLVENVLQMARSENGHLHVNPTTMAVAPIIRNCVEDFSVLAQARSIEFRLELEEQLVAPVDSAALRQILLNLLDNAAKYGPVGQQVVVGLGLYEDTARLWVDDEGAGILPRDRQRVFDPFYRARDVSGTTGSGIGLAVVRELVVLHAGEVWIEPAPDAGTRVVVQFPGAYLAAQQSSGDIAVA